MCGIKMIGIRQDRVVSLCLSRELGKPAVSHGGDRTYILGHIATKIKGKSDI